MCLVDTGDLVTPGGLRIDAGALAWRFSRSPGPGGQHVNTSETRAQLTCDLAAAGLPEPVLARLVTKLGARVRVSSSTERSQRRNRDAALARLAAKLDDAAKVDPVRRKTRPSKSADRSRLDEKRRDALRKSARQWRPED
jgi:ribosome-associated protein